jgi:hypothetical protein
MRVTISKTGKPLNHRVLKVIYLLCFLVGMCGQVKCEHTTTVHLPKRVTYEWPLITNLQHTIRMWRIIYGKPNPQTHSVRTNSQPSPDTPKPPGRERQGQPASFTGRPAFLLASAFSQSKWQGTDARRGHCAAPQSPQGKGPLHKKADKLLRSGGQIWC